MPRPEARPAAGPMAVLAALQCVPYQAMVRLRTNCSPPSMMKDTTVIIRPRRKRACLMILMRDVLNNSAASAEVQSHLRACWRKSLRSVNVSGST